MTFFRNVLRASDNIVNIRNSFVLNKNNWNHESYFGSKIEIPSPPKRPLTAYMIFCKEHRQVLLKDNPSLTAPQQIKILAEKWGRLSGDMKKPYEVSARQSTLLYGEEHKKFYEGLTEEQKDELARLKAKKLESRRMLRYKRLLSTSGLPKNPNSAYGIFVQSEAKKTHSQSNFKHPTDFIKKVAESWKLLPEESKKMFTKQAEDDKKRYVEEMKEWRTRMLLDNNKKVLKAFEELKGKFLEEEEPVEAKKSTKKTVKSKN